MADNFDYSEENLNKFSYRGLQQLAKSMCLPSNVKKMYLIQMIYAKRNCSNEVLQDIVDRVKLERKLSQGTKKRSQKKNKLQATEVTSTKNIQSPPIGITPKRRSPSNSPPPRQSLLRCPKQPSQIRSDRVLRSFNVKSYKKPNYSLMNSALIGVIKAESPKANLSIIRYDDSYPKLNMSMNCIVRRCRPVLNGVPCLKTENQIVSKVSTVPQINKRPATGLHTPNTPEVHPMNYPSLQRIGFRHTDGKISKINAIVHKPPKSYERKNPNVSMNQVGYRNVEVTIQDIINSNINAQTVANPSTSEYVMSGSNTTNISYAQNPTNGTVYGNRDVTHNTSSVMENEKGKDEKMTIYYHKKIRGEQVRTQRQCPVRDVPRKQANEHRLPHISDVFSSFNSHVRRDLTKPLYVQVSDAGLASVPINASNTPILESLYNLRMFPNQQSLLQIAATAGDNTKCVYTTPLLSCVMAPTTYAPAADFNTACEENNNYERLHTNDDVSQSCDFFDLPEQDITLRKYHEAFTASLASEETEYSQIMDTTAATIPEMVEDALEIISQDGDYMERLGMDVRVQCILCDWAGPKIIFEIHIRKEHTEKITVQDKNNWNVTYKLGTVVNQHLWLSHVSEYERNLYTVSVKFEDPDCFMATLSVLSTDTGPIRNGSITIYNKITGEPYTWEGEIQELDANMPYENSPQLKLALSQLELVPNSARLKLVGRTLVPVSPGKAVVGQPQLDDIHIIIFVQIF